MKRRRMRRIRAEMGAIFLARNANGKKMQVQYAPRHAFPNEKRNSQTKNNEKQNEFSKKKGCLYRKIYQLIHF